MNGSENQESMPAVESQPVETIPSAVVANSPPESPPAVAGPLNLQQIRKMREAQQRAQQRPDRSSNRGPSDRGPSDRGKQSTPAPAATSDSGSGAVAVEGQTTAEATTPHPSMEPAANSPAAKKIGKFRGKRDADDGESGGGRSAQREPDFAPKVAVPNLRDPLSPDLQDELEQALLQADLDKLLVGDKSVQVGRALEEGARVSARIIKIHHENVFVSLGGPDEGVIPLLQFQQTPQEGEQIECLVRAYNRDDGLYELALPGEAISVEDWSDLQDGSVVEAKVESANTGGLECLVGSIRGFIPMSQISEFRVETPADYVGQKLLCIVTEANPRRGNLVLSHRAVMEREKREKRAERLAQLEVGQVTEGTVRKVTDFGAFVDIGGLDGLIHVSQLSWERITHPSEVVKEGDKVQVKIEKVDPETGKIGLSYRALQDHPWEKIDQQFPVGSVVRGTVSRLANFGAFVKLATGVEGLVHITELAHRRVANVGAVVKEGDVVDVKILSVDRDAQRIGLSIKAASATPETEVARDAPEEVVEPVRAPAVPKRDGPLKGGIGSSSSGEKFGLKW